MTFSVVARDSATGDLGIAVASKFLAVGAVVSHARAGTGAVATQALANVRYGPEGLDLMGGAVAASEALRQLVEADEGRDHRQAGFVDAHGRCASHTGANCVPWAGGRTADGLAVQGNLLAGAAVVDAAYETFLAGGLPFPELLLRALKAGDEEGGVRRGRQSAALLVVRDGGGYGGGSDRWIDLRTDDHVAPIDELARLLELNHLYLDRPDAADLVAIDESLATEMRELLTRVGYTPEQVEPGGGLSAVVAAMGVPRTGEPRQAPPGWDEAWEAALSEWMSIENLEERSAARGWLDPRVLEFMRDKAGDSVG